MIPFGVQNFLLSVERVEDKSSKSSAMCSNGVPSQSAWKAATDSSLSPTSVQILQCTGDTAIFNNHIPIQFDHAYGP